MLIGEGIDSRLDDKHLNIEYVLKSELCSFGGKYDPKTLYACQAKEKAAQEIVLRGLVKPSNLTFNSQVQSITRNT